MWGYGAEPLVLRGIPFGYKMVHRFSILDRPTIVDSCLDSLGECVEGNLMIIIILFCSQNAGNFLSFDKTVHK